jgi:hypothetical protein
MAMDWSWCLVAMSLLLRPTFAKCIATTELLRALRKVFVATVELCDCWIQAERINGGVVLLRHPSSARRILMSASCARHVPRVFKAAFDLVVVGMLPHGLLRAWLASRLVRAGKAESTLRSRQDPESIQYVFVLVACEDSTYSSVTKGVMFGWGGSIVKPKCDFPLVFGTPSLGKV